MLNRPVVFIFRLLSLFLTSTATSDYELKDFIIDYFVYKDTPSVVGFLCTSMEDNFVLVKKFNKFGIRSAISTSSESLSNSQFIKTEYWRLGILLDTSCFSENKIYELFSEAKGKQYFGEQQHWLILGSNIDSILSKITDDGFGLSTDLVISPPMLGGRELYDVYNPWKNGGGRINITHMGTWTKTFGLNITLLQKKFVRRANLHGIVIRASCFRSKHKPKNMSIEQYLQDYTSKIKDGSSKFGYNILLHLSDMYNISFKFGEVKKWLDGDQVGPLSRALFTHEIEFSSSPIVMTIERISRIKFIYPTWPFKTCFIFRNPQPQEIKIGEILHPFSNESWALTSIFIVLLILFLSVTLKFEGIELSQIRFSNAFLIVTGAFCQQGTDMNMHKISTRIMFFNILLFSLLTYTFYSAKIISTRLNEPIFKMNDSLSELSKTDLRLAAEPLVYFDFIMGRLPAWDRKVFYDNRWMPIPKDEKFMFPDKAIPMIRQGGFAYHTHPDNGYPGIDKTFTYREICELMEVYTQPLVYATIGVSYNSTFIEIAKVGFAKMTEVGIRNRQLLRYTSRQLQCYKDKVDIESTDIYEFAPHLILLFIGMVCSALIFFIEKVVANQILCRKKQNKFNHFSILSYALMARRSK